MQSAHLDNCRYIWSGHMECEMTVDKHHTDIVLDVTQVRHTGAKMATRYRVLPRQHVEMPFVAIPDVIECAVQSFDKTQMVRVG